MTYALAVGAGLVLLLWGADRFVTGSASLARAAGIPTLAIGLTVVALGTSAPELLVSSIAALENQPGLSVGNAVGSNIANIGLVLGVAAVLTPLEVRSSTLRREFPALLLVTLLTLALIWPGRLGRAGALVLLGSLAALVAWLLWLARRSAAGDPLRQEYSVQVPPLLRTPPALWRATLGLAALVGGSRLVVWGAVGVARGLGVSELVIGLSVVAVGTSLPELAASAAGALRGEHDLAIGNVIGSNMVNLLAAIGVPALLHPLTITPAVRERDFPVMIALTLVLYAMCRGGRGRDGRVSRLEGALLLASFCAYQAWLWVR